MEMKKESRFKKFFKRNKDRRNKQTESDELKDLVIHLVFLLVTTIIATSSREIGMFYFNNTIERLFYNRFTSNQHGLELAYEDLVTISDWWSFVETTFVDGISQFETKEISTNVSSDGNILLGPARLRQIRVKSEPCKIDKIFQNQFKSCFGQYTRSTEDMSPFFNKAHSSQIEANTYGVSGILTNYHGAGYIEFLGLNKEENEQKLAQLKDAPWVDTATRLIIIEFILFNSNANIFCNAKFLAEISPTGGVVTSSQFQALRYFAMWNHEGFLVISCSVVFMGLILYFTVTLTSGAIANELTSIYESFFNILRFVILLIAYTTVIYIPWHKFSIKSMLKNYDRESNQFISLDKICYWNGRFIDLIGVCVFIVWIQVFKYIKFNKTMMQFSSTLQRCAKDLLGFSIMFAIVLTAFALLAVMIFGTVHSGFCNFSKAVITLMRTVLGDFDFEKLEAANRYLGPIFFVSFILFVFFILMNMFLAIINDTYADVKSEAIEEKKNLLEEIIKSLVGKIKSFILPTASKKIDGKTDDNDPQVSKIMNEQNNRTYQDQELNNFNSIIDKYFEIISTNMDDDNDKESLSFRVTILEKKVEQIISNLSGVLRNE